jgi:hypothetical protein
MRCSTYLFGSYSDPVTGSQKMVGTLCTVEFIPLSFWYDAPRISRYSDRRHDPGRVYGFPSYSRARWSSWIAPAGPAPRVRRGARPARPRSTPGWRRGGWMGKPGLRAGLPSTNTVRSRHQQIGCCSAWSPSNPLSSRWCQGADAGWSRAQPPSGCLSSCRRGWGRCAPSVRPLPALCPPSHSGLASRRRPRRPWSRP